MELEMSPVGNEYLDFAWSLYSEYVRHNLFSGASGRRGVDEWREDQERQKFADYWAEGNKYLITVDGEKIGWSAIVRTGGKIEIENWHLDAAWRNKNISSIILGNLVPKWRAEGLQIETSLLQGTPAAAAAEAVLAKLDFAQHGISNHSKLMRAT
jgi:hypothetical protein